MKWNNGYERKRFEANQKKLAEEYRKAGMTEEQIKAMYEFDLEQFKKDRIYQMHTQALQVEEFDELDADNGASKLAKMILEECTEICMFVGTAQNVAYKNSNLPFELSARMNLIDQLKEVGKEIGKNITVKYY